MLRRLGVIETRLGYAAAAKHVGEAMTLTSKPRQRAALALELSVGHLVAGGWGEAVGTLEQAIRQTEEHDRELRWPLEAQLLEHCAYRQRPCRRSQATSGADPARPPWRDSG